MLPGVGARSARALDEDGEAGQEVVEVEDVAVGACRRRTGPEPPRRPRRRSAVVLGVPSHEDDAGDGRSGCWPRRRRAWRGSSAGAGRAWPSLAGEEPAASTMVDVGGVEDGEAARQPEGRRGCSRTSRVRERSGTLPGVDAGGGGAGGAGALRHDHLAGGRAGEGRQERWIEAGDTPDWMMVADAPGERRWSCRSPRRRRRGRGRGGGARWPRAAAGRAGRGRRVQRAGGTAGTGKGALMPWPPASARPPRAGRRRARASEVARPGARSTAVVDARRWFSPAPRPRSG